MTVSALVGLTAFSGAFVAGNHAGLIYDEFPTMGGTLVPSDLWNPYIQPAWRNVFEHDTMVQFNHRVLAMLTLTSVIGLYGASRRLVLPSNARRAANHMLAMAGVQVGLGISTLLMHVPVPLASLHQMGSLTLLTFSFWFVHTLLPLPVRASLLAARAAAAARASSGATKAVGTSSASILALAATGGGKQLLPWTETIASEEEEEDLD